MTVRARTTDPITSHLAAQSVRNLRESQQAVLSMFHDRLGLTDEQIARYYPADAPRQSPSGLRTRRAELVDLGLLKDSGSKRRLQSGRLAIIWTLEEAVESTATGALSAPAASPSTASSSGPRTNAGTHREPQPGATGADELDDTRACEVHPSQTALFDTPRGAYEDAA